MTTLWTTWRVLTQLRHDPRTIGLLLVVPALLLVLLRYVFDAQPAIFDRIGLVLLGVFPFITMFLVTSVAMLRERSSGTLERLLSTPLSKLSLLLGYGLAFALAAAAQAAIAVGLAYWWLDLSTAGSAWLVVLVAVTDAVLGMAMGLFFSAFARSEFQAVQFMPAVVFPQVLLCGLIWPREQMVGWLQAISRVMPMTYAVQALSEIGGHADPTGLLWRDLAIVVAAAVAALLLGAATLRRRTG
jgi:ABC-2 type transport system permease protein